MGNDYWIVKTDSAGIVLWDQTIGGSATDYLYAVLETPEGGFLLGGYSYSGISGDKTEENLGEQDYWIVKTDATGNIDWQKTIGGDETDVLRALVPVEGGGFLLGGYSSSDVSGNKSEDSFGEQDYWVVMTDDSGNLLWDQTIGGSATDNLYTMVAAEDGGYLVGGHSSSDASGNKEEDSEGSYDYWTVKLEGPFVCNAPTELTVLDLTPMSATLAWEDAGADVTGYKFQLIDLGTASRFHLNLGEGTTELSIGPAVLSPGADYGFRLRALCSDGSRTPWSAPAFFSTPLRQSEHAVAYSLYPNPSSGQFALELSGLQSEMAQVEVFDLTGAMVHAEDYQIQSEMLHGILVRGYLPEGSYLLRSVAEQTVILEPLLIER